MFTFSHHQKFLVSSTEHANFFRTFLNYFPERLQLSDEGGRLKTFHFFFSTPCRYLIRGIALPALLCHKEPAPGKANQATRGICCLSLVLYGIRAPIIDPFCAWKPPSRHPKYPTWVISCLSLVLYGIRIGAFHARKGPFIGALSP